MRVSYKVGDTIRYRLPGGETRICVVLERRTIVGSVDGFDSLARGFLGKELDDDGNEVPQIHDNHDGCWGYDRDVLEVLVGPT